MDPAQSPNIRRLIPVELVAAEMRTRDRLLERVADTAGARSIDRSHGKGCVTAEFRPPDCVMPPPRSDVEAPVRLLARKSICAELTATRLPARDAGCRR